MVVFNALFLAYTSVRAFFLNEAQGYRAVMQVIAAQIYFTGFQALPLISVLALATGSLVILQSTSQLSLLGGSGMMGSLLVSVVFRELAPLMTALVVVARSGTAVASELGNMKVNREIEALELMGIHPLSYVVFPRLVGGIISLMCLGIYYAVIAFVGGFIVTQFVSSMSIHAFINLISEAISLRDLYFFSLKIFVAGLMVFSVCCYYGLSVGRGSHEVPQVTTKAVVHSLLTVTGCQVVISAFFYVGRLMEAGLL
ncbi:ABC transporter permease [bacterium]|nr:ABC transporter permease [bacterium]